MSYFPFLAILGVPGGYEWLIILVVALLIFGKRLPEVARNMGKGIVEFKKGVKGIENDVDDQSQSDQSSPNRHVYSPSPDNPPAADSSPVQGSDPSSAGPGGPTSGPGTVN